MIIVLHELIRLSRLDLLVVAGSKVGITPVSQIELLVLCFIAT